MNRQKRVSHVVALIVMGVSGLAVPALADCPEPVGRLPGPISAVAVEGDYAYLGSGSGLLIADVSDPSAPVEVGSLEGTHGDVAVAGSYAYVAGEGLHVIDVSTPSAPVEVGFLDGRGGAVTVSGNYAYIAYSDYDWQEAGLRVIDVSAPSAPVEVGAIGAPYPAHDVVVSGGYAYVAWGWSDLGAGGLRVIDVRTPSAPVEVATLPTPGEAYGIAVSGSYVYVADADAGLRVIDVSTPSAPVEIGSLDVPMNRAFAVAVSDGYAYVADLFRGLVVIDVSTPSAPVEVGFVESAEFNDVAQSGGYAYAADWYSGLSVIDVSTPSAPVEVGVVATIEADDVAVSGGYTYVVGAGFHVIDVSTPSAPVEVGATWWSGRAVAVSGTYAYVVSAGLEGSTFFSVIDVSTPSAPVGMSTIETAAEGRDVAVSGGYAYAVGQGGLSVIDVSTPSAPVEVASLDSPDFGWAVAVSGSYAYVVGWDGLRVIDVGTPSAPVDLGILAFFAVEGGTVALSDGYAYVTGGGLHVFDVSTPSTPVEVGFLDGVGGAVAVAGGYAYVAGGGLHVIDVSMPSAPVEVGFLEGAGGAVAVGGGHVFVAAGWAGMDVYRDCAEGPSPDARECFIPAAAVAAGAQGAFFQTDVEINNTGTEEARAYLQWLPRGEDNSNPLSSDLFTLDPGQSLRYDNVLAEVFGLEPDALGALKLVASTESVIGMSRTYNIPAGETAGTFGQGLPAIRATEMIQGSEPQRIIFLSEDPDSRANVGCVNGTDQALRINIGAFDAEGDLLETRTMDLAPYSNDQINRIFEDYAPVNGYVDVWADSDEALYYCYGSMLDNLTSDPTTILPQVPSADMTFIPAAALAAGAEGSFFTTDVDLNNVGSTDLTYDLLWLPRGADNSDPIRSDLFSLAPGAGVRYANVLDEVFGLTADQVGALTVEEMGGDLLAMSRTYNLPSAKVAGTFGQELPGIPADQMIPTGVKKRIIFMSENDDVRANVGCINGAGTEVAVAIELYDSDGGMLETKYMMLPPYSNRQINGIFQNYAPINGYVDVRTYTPDALIYCYGSVLDNVTSDPTTVLPQ